MKNSLIILSLFLVTLVSCSQKILVKSNNVLYNSYLVKHKKYQMEQVFNYPSNVNFWSVQDSTVYKMIDTLKYKVTYKELSK
jgi:hypothetical protein